MTNPKSPNWKEDLVGLSPLAFVLAILTKGVKLTSDFRNTPTDAGFMVMAEMSPPKAVNAPPMALTRAVPLLGVPLNLTMSSKFCACAIKANRLMIKVMQIFFMACLFYNVHIIVSPVLSEQGG